MTFVNITALTVPKGAEAEIEQRFAHRQKGVDASDGFLGFELLRPKFGEDRYFVVTRWESEAHYQRWSDARPKGKHADDERRGMSVAVLGFEVVGHDDYIDAAHPGEYREDAVADEQGEESFPASDPPANY